MITLVSSHRQCSWNDVYEAVEPATMSSFSAAGEAKPKNLDTRTDSPVIRLPSEVNGEKESRRAEPSAVWGNQDRPRFSLRPIPHYLTDSKK